MRRLILCLLLAVLSGATGFLWLTHKRSETPVRELALFGNVDLRQAELPFNNSERIAAVFVQEGERVTRGQVLARLDTSRLEPLTAQAEAQVAAQRNTLERLRNGSRPEEVAQVRAQAAAQQANVDRLHNGSRPEELAQARANVDAAKADASISRVKYERLHALAGSSGGQAVSEQDVDNAKSAWDGAEARLAFSRKALELAVAGPRKEDIAQAEATLAYAEQALALSVAGTRKEDIAQAEAQLRGLEAQLALQRQTLADAQLVAPCDGVVRSRLMEPGEMANPQKAVISLAIVDPKWIRAYVSEPDLGKLHQGAHASATVDGFPALRFEGWIGFISPVAEFTPKNVQTEELRTSLVYEVRIFVKDPADILRLGMPATVHVPLEQPGAERQP